MPVGRLRVLPLVGWGVMKSSVHTSMFGEGGGRLDKTGELGGICFTPPRLSQGSPPNMIHRRLPGIGFRGRGYHRRKNFLGHGQTEGPMNSSPSKWHESWVPTDP